MRVAWTWLLFSALGFLAACGTARHRAASETDARLQTGSNAFPAGSGCIRDRVEPLVLECDGTLARQLEEMRALTPDGERWLGLCVLHGLESGIFRAPPRLVIETCQRVADELSSVEGARVRVFGGMVQVDGISPSDPGYVKARRIAQSEKDVVVRVSKVDLLALRESLRRQLGDIPGLSIRLAGDSVLVEGDLQSRSDIERVRAVTEPGGKRLPDVFAVIRLDPEVIRREIREKYPY